MEVLINNAEMNEYSFDPTNFKLLFVKEGISEYTLSEITGVHQPTINRIKNGLIKSPNFNILKKLADHYGVTFAQFIGESPLDTDSEAEKQLYWIEVIAEEIEAFQEETKYTMSDAQKTKLMRLGYKALHKANPPENIDKNILKKLVRQQIGKIFVTD